jgi:hypothetical protein
MFVIDDVLGLFNVILDWVNPLTFFIAFMSATWVGKLLARVLRNILFPYLTGGIGDAGRAVVVKYKTGEGE